MRRHSQIPSLLAATAQKLSLATGGRQLPPPRMTTTILGKLYFLFATGSYFGCGRAATQPLVSR